MKQTVALVAALVQCAILSVACAPCALAVGTPYQVADINAIADVSHNAESVTRISTWNDRAWLQGPAGLYATDGTPGGTEFITNPYSGPIPLGRFTYFVSVKGATIEDLFVGLYRTDGTAAGATLVKALDFLPGEMFATDTHLFLAGWVLPSFEQQTWVSNGTTQGTYKLLDSYIGGASLGNVLLFLQATPDNRAELWRSDGTVTGTSLLVEFSLGPNGSYPSGFIRLGTKMLFTASDGVSGKELWITDGTVGGTTRLADIVVGAGSPQLGEFVLAGDKIFFTADDGAAGWELWVTDGTPVGTKLVTDLNPGGAPSYPLVLVALGERLLFVANDGVGGNEPWVTDGTATGTVKLLETQPGPESDFGSRFLTVGAVAYFTVDPDGPGQSLWKTDGTPGGTTMVAAIPSGWSDGKAIGDALIFTQRDPVSGHELWRTDGTAAGTLPAADITPGTPDSHPQLLTSIRDRILFVADDGLTGREPWVSDGTQGGTMQLADLSDRTQGSKPRGFLPYEDAVIFLADDGVNGTGLWRSTGRAAETELLRLVGTEDGIQVMPQGTLPTGTVHCIRRGGVNDAIELWHSDGTPAGTTPIKTFPGTVLCLPDRSARYGDVILFEGADAQGGELWRTDGTAVGTVRVADINPGPSSSDVTSFVTLGGDAYFTANDGVHGRELYKTDGTAGGTVLVKDIASGAVGSLPGALTKFGPGLCLVANDGIHGSELWCGDGTTNGTNLVKDIRPGIASANARPLVQVGGMLYFAADDGVHGMELWRSDGTAGGTELVADINPGPASSMSNSYNPAAAAEIDGAVVFAARDAVSNTTLWRSDGTASGTVRLGGPTLSASQLEFIRLGDVVVVFGESAAGLGRTIWITDGTAEGTHPADPFVSTTSSGDRGTVNGTIFFEGADQRQPSGEVGELFAIGGCGDGLVAGDEACDDGNNSGGDCCSPSCELEVGACEDGNPCTTGETCSGSTCGGGAPVSCALCESCDAIAGCLPGPRPEISCKQPTSVGAARLLLKDNVKDGSDALTLAWSKGEATLPAEIGDPTTATDFAVCVFDESTSPPSILLRASLPGGSLCNGKPCWKALGKPAGALGARYSDPLRSRGGISTVVLKPGATGKAQVTVKGRGIGLEMPGEPDHLHTKLPLATPVNVRVQIQNEAQCWESTFSGAGLLKNDIGQLRMKSE